MRYSPRMVLGCLLLTLPVACTEAPQFMKDEQKSGVVIFAGQFAQGSMFRDNNAPESVYISEPPTVAAAPAPVSARHAAPVLAERSPRPAPAPLRAPSTAITMPSPI